MSMKKIISYSSLLFSLSTLAHPLGTVPLADEMQTRIILDFRSDLWLKPKQDKLEPQRFFNAEIRIPVFRNQQWKASVSAQNELISLGRTDLLVGPQQVSVGSSLRTQAIGLGVGHTGLNGSSVSVFSNYISASNEPFRDQRDRWVEVSALYSSSRQDGQRWILMVDKSANRGFINGQWFPYVGIERAYSSEFSYAFGFPFLLLNWKMKSGCNALVIATPVGARASSSFRVAENFLMQSQAGISVRSYLHSNRVSDDSRFFFEEKFMDTGFAYKVTEQTKLGASVGVSFDRFVYESNRVFTSDDDRLRLNSDFYGRLTLEFSL